MLSRARWRQIISPLLQNGAQLTKLGIANGAIQHGEVDDGSTIGDQLGCDADGKNWGKRTGGLITGVRAYFSDGSTQTIGRVSGDDLQYGVYTFEAGENVTSYSIWTVSDWCEFFFFAACVFVCSATPFFSRQRRLVCCLCVARLLFFVFCYLFCVRAHTNTNPTFPLTLINVDH